MISEERKARNRQRIIEVSTRLFTSQGIPMTTIAQIAAEADVVDRTVLNIFGSKNNLVLEAVVTISNRQLKMLREAAATPEYEALSGLEQTMFILRRRGEALRTEPELLLLLSEVKVRVSRSCQNSAIIERYMENIQAIRSIAERSLDKGLRDGSLYAGIDKKQALSVIVHAFRAVLQQLAQVKLNPAFNRLIDVEEELETQYSVIRAILAGHAPGGANLRNEQGEIEL